MLFSGFLLKRVFLGLSEVTFPMGGKMIAKFFR